MANLKYKHTAYTSAQWASLNPVIVENEIVIESDTKRTKIGNGISTYNQLEYADANSIGNSLGSIKPTAAAPTPQRNGNYTFSIGGNKPAWLTAEAGVTTVKAGDGVSVVYTAPSGYSYMHVDTGSSIEQARSQSTSKVPSSKLLDDELNKLDTKYFPLDKSDNLIDINAAPLGQISSTGVIGTSVAFRITDYIPVSELGIICGCAFVGSVGHNIYDINKIRLRTITNTNQYTYQEGDFWVKFTIDVRTLVPMANYGTVLLPYKPFSLTAKIDSKIVTTKITDDDTINSCIKGLYLIGLDVSKTYFISQLSVALTGLRSIYIKDEFGITVAHSQSTLAPIDGLYYALSTDNASGVTGYAFIDVSKAYAFNSINAMIYSKNVIVKSDYIKNIFETSFMSLDTTIRRNKYNPEHYIPGKNWATQTGYLLTNPISHTGFNLYNKIIPLAKDASYTISNTPLYNCTAYIISAERKILLSIALTNGAGSVDNFKVITNTTGVDAYLAFSTGALPVTSSQYPQLEYSSEKTDYQAYLTEATTVNDVEIILPKSNYLIAGKNYNIYKKCITNCNPLKLYDITCPLMPTYLRQFNITPSNIGTSTFIFSVNDNKKKLCRAARNFIVFAKTTGIINVLPAGDSFTDGADWVLAMYQNAVSDGVTINLIGLKNSLSTKRNESQSGGTLLNTFMSDRGPAFLLTVTGFVNDGGTDNYVGDVLADSLGYQYVFDGRKVDVNGDGVIRLYPKNSHAHVPPANSVLTKISGTIIYNSINYTNVSTINRNPFWNPATSQLDFSYYLNLYNYQTDLNLTTSKFVLALQFSWNDNTIPYDPANVTSVVTNFKTAIDKFHTQYPNAYVLIAIEPAASTLGGSATAGVVMDTNWARMEFAKAIFAQFEIPSYSNFVYISPAYAYVDVDNAFDGSDVVLSSRFPAIIDKKMYDGVHCNQAGMFQIGDANYTVIQYILKQ